MAKILHNYKNGNYSVSLYDNGTKVRETDDDYLLPELPEHSDIKLTNYCDNPICRSFCHEKSNMEGVHGDLELGLNLLKTWKIPAECAFGGGSTLSHPDIIPFLKEVKNTGLISNITVNSYHFSAQKSIIQELLSKDLIKGIGCSYFSNKDYLPHIQDVCGVTNNLVFHLIIGIHTIEDVKFICNNFENANILLLGYKQYGNGADFYNKQQKFIDNKIYNWYINLYTLFDIKNLTLSFDNLSIKQLNIKRFFNDKNWNTFYQGDDGQFSFFADLVNKNYTISSTNKNRFSINKDISIKEIFEKVRKMN